MMYPSGTPGSQDAALEQLWRQVCVSRGTPSPNLARLAGFTQGLGPFERERLESVLSLAARGREPPGELSVLSWAAACTRPALLDQLATHGLGYTSACLFGLIPMCSSNRNYQNFPRGGKALVDSIIIIVSNENWN